MKEPAGYCRHLDFSDDKYSNCKKVNHPLGVVCWQRGPEWLIDSSSPEFVQFCELRGRLNDPRACTCQKLAKCHKFEIDNIFEMGPMDFES